MKLVVLSPFVYYPGVPNGGGALCWGQLVELTKDHEVHFLSFVPPKGNELGLARPHLLSICKSVTTVVQQISRIQVAVSKVGAIARWEPKVASLCRTEEMRNALQTLIAQTQPDAVIIQFPQMAQYVTECENSPTLMDVQDAFSVSAYRSFKAASTAISKFNALVNWMSWVKYESRWYPRFSNVMALTQQDAHGLEIFNPGLGTAVSPAAVAIPEESWSPSNKQTIAFIGSFAHLPNEDAVLFFAQEILPLVLKELPDVVFQIAGKGATSRMAAAASKNIQILGMVANSTEFLCSASVVVIPLRSGGGIKIKTLEAMAGGCPIVSTSIGAEETGVVSGKHLHIADSPAEFADSVVALLKDKVKAKEMGSNARTLAQERFSWSAKRLSMNRLLELARKRNFQ